MTTKIFQEKVKEKGMVAKLTSLRCPNVQQGKLKKVLFMITKIEHSRWQWIVALPTSNAQVASGRGWQNSFKIFKTDQNQICEALVWKPWEVSWSMKKPSNRVRCFSFFPACSQTERCGKIESEVDIHSTFSQTTRQFSSTCAFSKMHFSILPKCFFSNRANDIRQNVCCTNGSKK